MQKQERVSYIKSKSLGFKTSIIALMSALTTVTTMVISIYIPASEGFFNIGESMVYVSAILFGPVIGGLSGGIGSFLADILLGFVNYAPGTLIIKGLEGYIVGFIYSKLKESQKLKQLKNLLILILSLMISISLVSIGILYYTGIAEFSGFNYLWVFNINLTVILWIIISILSFIGIMYIERKKGMNVSNAIISMLIGGIEMVVGYLLYATFLLGYLTAYVEIPFNIMQCIIGIIIAISLISPLENMIELKK